jgi:MoxR-like ATPase
MAKPPSNPPKKQNNPSVTDNAEPKLKTFNPGKVTHDKTMSIIEHVLDNMQLQHGTGILLGGDPGVGKTTFVKRFAKLIGLPAIIVEAPHITEEHLINIPFVVFNGQNAGKTQDVKVNPEKFEITLAQSHLASELEHLSRVPDDAFIKQSATFDQNLVAYWNNLGGEAGVIPKEIKQVRSRYRAILFLDEYYRQTSANVRNILRGILNGKLGNDQIPRDVFIVYASNLSDNGNSVEDIPTNNDFKIIEFSAPSADEWFHYITSKFEKDTKVQLKKIVVDTFYNVLEDNHLSFQDLETEIRTSPRRWEQILLYINAALPVETEEEASALLTNIRANFKNQDKTSVMYKAVRKTVQTLINLTNNKIGPNTTEMDDSNWRLVLKHQIDIKKKLGDHRQYIPIVQGLPGIGKTAEARQLAKDENMMLIDIDCSTLTVDEISGIPLPGESKSKNIAVKFSPPALYQSIMNDIAKDEKDFFANGDKADIAKYKNQPFKYLIFFDEINRVKNINVFNALRRVLLEKSFSDQIKLPEGSIVIAAMNPNDKGTLPLTNHMADVVDLIDTAPSWNKLEPILEKYAHTRLKHLSTTSTTMTLNVIKAFVSQFSQKNIEKGQSADSTKFYIAIKGANKVYISPREFDTMYQEMAQGAERQLSKGGLDEDALINKLTSVITDRMVATLKTVFLKHDVDSPQFLNEVANWMKTTGIVAKSLTKTRTVAGLDTILSDVIENYPKKHLTNDLDFNSYIDSFELNKFAEDFKNFLTEYVKSKKDKVSFFMTKQHSKREVENEKIKITNETVSELEFIAREIINAAKIHKLSNEVVDSMTDKITEIMHDIAMNDPDIGGDDDSEDVWSDDSAFVKVIKEIQMLRMSLNGKK